MFGTYSPLFLMNGTLVGQGCDDNDAGDRFEADTGIHDPTVEHHELVVPGGGDDVKQGESSVSCR